MENIRKYCYLLLLLGFAQITSTVEDYSKMSVNELNETLIIAVKRCSSEEVQKLVRAGAHVDQTISCIETMGDCDWDITYTLLEYAAKHGYVDIVKELLQANPKNDDINKALILAAREGRAKVVRELVQAKPRVDTLNRALLAAAHECHASVIEELIRAGADVNYTDEHGNTALIEVIKYPSYTEGYSKHIDNKYRVQTIQDLIKAGAHVNHANKIGSTALIQAVEEHNFDVVQILLQVPEMTTGSYFDFGTKPINYANKDGNTALIRAVQCIQYSYIVGDNIQYNNCLNSQNIVKTLLQTPGINLHHVNKNGDTAIKLLEKIIKK